MPEPDHEEPPAASSGLEHRPTTADRAGHGYGTFDGEDSDRSEWLEDDTLTARSASPEPFYPNRRNTISSISSSIRSRIGTILPDLDNTSLTSPTVQRRRQYSLSQEEETNPVIVSSEPSPDDDDDDKPVSWRSLPKKRQLTILTLARLSEPLAQTSLQAYMFYQLKSFNPSLPDSTISAQSGILQGAFTAAQFFTAVIWGRLADTDTFGRKRVLLIGLSGTCISCLGFGFSKSFLSAAIFRTLGGALNSNVGIMRTLISEIVEEKKYQTRAFLLLPMCFNVGVIIGPIIGGILADPVQSYPGIFGPGSFLGGEDGVWWMRQWPYALPNVFSTFIIFCATIGILLGLEETHEIAKQRDDWGLQLGKTISKYMRRSRDSGYKPLNPDGPPADDIESRSSISNISARTISNDEGTSAPIRRKRLPFRQIWTRNVILTLVNRFMLMFHASAFTSLCFTFLPAPRASESSNGFLHFSGGLGMPSSKVGLATSIIGFVGLPLQIFAYPRVQFKLGTLKSYRVFLPFSPLAYLIAPFLVLLPDLPYLVWPALAIVISLQVISRTFALPSTAILVNNSIPDPSVLGTVHGVAQSVSCAALTLGPVVAGWGLGLGLQRNIVGAIWWAIALEAMLNWVLSWTIHEGKGFQKKPR